MKYYEELETEVKKIVDKSKETEFNPEFMKIIFVADYFEDILSFVLLVKST